MDRLATLLGSRTRAKVLEALALSSEPLTPYRVARQYNMNVSKVYLEVKVLTGLGLVAAAGRRRGVEYRLRDPDLTRLALKLSTRVVPYDKWKDQRGTRFRDGFRRIPDYIIPRPRQVVTAKETRLPGELDALADMGRRRFDSKYKMTKVRKYARV